MGEGCRLSDIEAFIEKEENMYEKQVRLILAVKLNGLATNDNEMLPAQVGYYARFN